MLIQNENRFINSYEKHDILKPSHILNFDMKIFFSKKFGTAFCWGVCEIPGRVGQGCRCDEGQSGPGRGVTTVKT